MIFVWYNNVSKKNYFDTNIQKIDKKLVQLSM